MHLESILLVFFGVVEEFDFLGFVDLQSCSQETLGCVSKKNMSQ